MRRSSFSTNIRLAAGLVALIAASACTDTVYRDRAPFTPPPDAASGFLGYFDASAKQTNCGNCHVGHQADWKQTKHAQAWADLQAVPIPDKSSCVGCHTVSENGNLATGPAGYTKVADAGYEDVQCESCHGPGNDHVQAPDVALAPLASIHVDTTTAAGATPAAGSCAACHQDTHHPFWEDWRQSLHARMGRHNDEELCLQCHSGQGALEAWGVTSAYKEQHQLNEGITCSVCHDPHNDANPGQLRYSLSSTDVNQQLCMKCHNRRSTPIPLDSTRGAEDPQGFGGSNSPHAPQGPTMLGTAGYQNLTYLDPTVATSSSHGNATKNPTLCAGCHVYSFPATNDAGAAVTATGHLFRPIPCIGPDNLPTDSIKNCAYSSTVRSFKSCTASGCHADEATAAAIMSVTRGRIQTLTTALWVNDGVGTGSSTSSIDTLDHGIIPAIYKATFANRGTVSNLSLQVKTAKAIGSTTIDLYTTGTALVTGKLAPLNTFKIAGDDQLYTVQDPVTAASNTLTAVHIAPALVKAAAVNAKVTVIYLGPLVAGDRLVTPVDGAEWNVRAFGEDANGVFMPGGNGTPSTTADRSHAVHNPFYAEAMLRANIAELTALYGSQPWFPAPSAALRAIMTSPLRSAGSSAR